MMNATEKELVFWYESTLGRYLLDKINAPHTKLKLWAMNIIIALISAAISYYFNNNFMVDFAGFFIFGACVLFTTIPAYELSENRISKSWSGISSSVDDPKSVAARRLHARNLSLNVILYSVFWCLIVFS